MNSHVTRRQMIEEIRRAEPVFFRNSPRPQLVLGQSAERSGVNPGGVADAADRMRRAQGLLARLFPDSSFPDSSFSDSPGRIESPLRALTGCAPLLVKCDGELPIAGSIKARGGIHEVLCHAEELALAAELINPGEDLLQLAGGQSRRLFAEHEICVGSTGNLGLSIGIAARALGFRAVIHMSRDAKQWKKQLLHSHGATVVEHDGDFSAAVKAGRAASADSPRSYFVDDENSTRLLYGYAAAAHPLRAQLAALGVYPTAGNPLCVYLPCGVGGGPAGIAYGLALEFGADAVESYTVEPTQAPALLLAVLEESYEGLHVSDYGLTLTTDADGLAVGTASVLAGPIIGALCSGLYTESDEAMRAYLRQVYDSDALRLELSAAAGLGGPARRAQIEGLRTPAAHLAWLTGGGLLPEDEFQRLLK